MIRRMAWFERPFTFDMPVWMYPNVVERVRGTPARMAQRVAALPPEILTRKDSGKWSIQEHAGHLLDLGALDLVRLDDYEAHRDRLRPADLQNRRTHEANHNAKPIESILEEFSAERAEFVRRLDAYDEEFVRRVALHPRLQTPLRVLDFAFFVAEHDDHHLSAMTELMREFET